ncbi:MAG: hypothetical protein JO061_22880 [Acidobacteriaceae bacterium]|nr:hypothetical protein [Acidobacteriaceae bacterium]
MDTRRKIIDLDRARTLLEDGDWVVIAGFFDPVTAAQARRLHALKREASKLMVMIEPADEALLPADARAALIAALRDVDAVVIANGDPQPLPSDHVCLIDDRAADRKRSEEFVEFILCREAGQ